MLSKRPSSAFYSSAPGTWECKREVALGGGLGRGLGFWHGVYKNW